MAEPLPSLKPMASSPILPPPVVPKVPKLSSVGPAIVKSTASAVSNTPSVNMNQGESRLRVEGKEVGKLLLNSPVGLASLVGGLTVDVGSIVLESVANLTPGIEYRAPEIGNTTYGHLGKSFWNTTYGLTFGNRREEYIQAWREGRPLTGMIIEDAGNISIAGGWLSKALSAGSKAATAGAAAAGAKAATKGPIGAARLAAKEQRLTSVAGKLETGAAKIKTVKTAADQAMTFPLKPYIWGYKGISQAARTGNIVVQFPTGGSVGTDFRFWGESAAKKYEGQLNALREADPDINATDRQYSDLVKQISFHNRIANHEGLAAIRRRAVRTGRHDADLMIGALEETRMNPMLKDDINPDTGEVYGPLTPIEEQAVIAVLNGRAQLVSHLSELDQLSPADVADFGRYDYSKEYSLTPEGAQLAVDYLNAHTNGANIVHPSASSKPMNELYYARLSKAVDDIAKIIIELSNKATEGYGRQSPLDAQYFTPLPFANKVKDALRRSGVKTKSGKSVYEIFLMYEEAGYFDLPVDNPKRQSVLKGFVEALPDDYALDSSMYPASMRENIEFFVRYRRKLRQSLVGLGEGEPMPSNLEPPVGPDEYRMTARKGAAGSVEKFINKTDVRIDKALAKIDKITKNITDAQKRYKKDAEKIQINDIIDEFVAGRDPKYLARKYQVPIAKVREILDGSSIVKLSNRIKALEAEIAPLEKIIGKTRAAMRLDQLETVEMQTMRAQYDQLVSEVEVTRQRIAEMQEVNEAVRISDEANVTQAAEDFYNLDDQLADAEQELIDAGGNPDEFIIKEDISDPAVMPMTPGQTKAFFDSVINHIDNELTAFVDENMPESAQDLQRSRTLLADTWNRAEKAFFDSEGEWEVHSSSMRMMQIGELYKDLEIALSSAFDPQTALQAVLDVLTNKETLDIISGVKRPAGLQLPRTAAAARRDSLFDKTDSSKRVNLDKPAVIDSLYEDFKDPAIVADLFGASTFGNTALMAEAASQLIRWIKEVQDASPKQKIELILNPPKYVDPQLARKLLTGMTRKEKDIPRAEVTHPIEVFRRRVKGQAQELIDELQKIENFYKTYGEQPKYVDWKTQAEDFTNRNAKDGHPRNKLTVDPMTGSVSIRVLDGLDYDSPTVPEIGFRANTPAQVVVKGIEAIINSIIADVGSQIRADKFNPGWFDGYFVGVTGLTRKLGKFADQAIADLEFIKTRIEARAKAVGDDFFASKDAPRLLGVAVKKTGELVGRQQFDGFQEFSATFAKETDNLYQEALKDGGYGDWTPEELRNISSVQQRFADIFAEHKYEADTVALDQKIYDFYNTLAREERQILFDSLSYMRDFITDAPRTQQNVRALTALDTVVDFLTDGKFKGSKEARLSIIEQSVEESQRLATGAVVERFKRLNEKSDFVIIPCGNAKMDTSAPASEFYTGSMFQDALRTARKLYTDDRIYVLSAKYGFVTLDQVLDPYDVKMGAEGSINASVLADSLDRLGIEGTFVSLLPKMYDKVFTEAAAGKFEIDHYFEGSRGIGDQKARLAQLRETAPETIEAPDIPKNMEGSIELAGEMEQLATILANDADSFQTFKDDTANAYELIKYLDEIKEPTLQDLTEFKTTFTARMQEEVNTIKGAMEDTLGAKWDRGTNKVTFYLTPVKNVPEWEWWFQLDARERRYIALNHFTSTETKIGYGRGGPRYERSAEAVDSLAESVNMTPEEFGDAMVAYIRQLRKSQKALAEAKKTKAEDFKEIYVDENLPEADAEAWKFVEENGLSPEEVIAVTDRANFLSQRDVTPADTPYKLRDIADNPDQVEYNMRIRNVNVRDAAYEVDLIDSMAKDAAKKMKAAERLSERMQALQEFIDKSKVHDARVQQLLKKRTSVEKLRLRQVARGEKIEELKEGKKALQKEARTLRATIKKVKTSPDYPRLTGSRGTLPLNIALDTNVLYPSEGRNVQLPGGRDVRLQGPMYVPTGKPADFAGGIRTELVREGLGGFQKSSSEYFRDGDRQTIFSIRLLAKRIEKDLIKMSNSEAYKAIIAQFGNKPLDVLGQTRIDELQRRAEQEALSYPIDRLHGNYDSIVKEAADAGEPLTDGIAAYAPGVKDPILSLKLATQDILGRLILEEMESMALRPIDPYKSITSSMRRSSINDQTMFVPDYLRESIAAIEVVIDPTTWNSVLRGMNSLTSKFKTGTLVLSLSWQLGDLFTNVMLATMTGESLSEMVQQLNNVKKIEYGTGWSGFKNLIDPKVQRPIVLNEIEANKVRIAKESPVQDISLADAQRRSLEGLKPDVPKPTRLNRVTKGRLDYPEMLQGRSVVKVAFKVNESINRITRHAFFLSKLDKALIEKGTSLDEIASTNGSWRFDPELKKVMEDTAQTANDYLGDFSDLSLFERKYVVGQIPFYAWIKHVHKVFVLLGKDHPQSIAWTIYMGNFMYDPNDDPLGLRYGGINFFGGVSSVNTFSPFADVAGGPIGALLLNNDLRPALNTLGPVPRLVGGLVGGFDVTKLEKLQRPAGTGQYTETGIASGGSLLPGLPGGSFTQTAGFAINQFPIAKRALQVLPGRNIPGTDIALGPVNTYLTGEARLNPTTRQRVEKWGGTPAAVARLFSVPLIPFKTEQQINEATVAARIRLASVEVLKKLREAQGTP